MQNELSSMLCQTSELGKTSRLELVLKCQSSSDAPSSPGSPDDVVGNGNLTMELTFERLLELLARILSKPDMLGEDLPVPTLRTNGRADSTNGEHESARVTARRTAVDLDAGRCDPRRLFVLVGMYMLQKSDLDWSDTSREYEMLVRRVDDTAA